jgi:hypothetical protein
VNRIQYNALRKVANTCLYKEAGILNVGKRAWGAVKSGGKAVLHAPKNAVNAVKNAPRNIAKKVTSPGAFKASFKAGEKVGRGAATVAHAGATVAAHAGSAAAGAAKGFVQKGFVEPAAKWAAKHPGAAKAVKYTAAGLGAAGAIGGGAYAIQKAKENNVEYGSRQPPRYY